MRVLAVVRRGVGGRFGPGAADLVLQAAHQFLLMFAGMVSAEVWNVHAELGAKFAEAQDGRLVHWSSGLVVKRKGGPQI